MLSASTAIACAAHSDFQHEESYYPLLTLMNLARPLIAHSRNYPTGRLRDNTRNAHANTDNS